MKIKYNTIIVNNIKESTQFYMEKFNLKKIEEFEEAGKFAMTMLTDGDNVIELIENKEDAKISSIGFEVENLDKTIEKLENKNVKFDYKPEKEGDLKVATFNDPNNIQITLSEKTL